MSIILNEKEWAMTAIEERDLGKHPTETLSRIARYYRKIDGYSKKETREKLGAFLLQCDPNAVLVKWGDTIDRVVKQADKFELVQLDGIPIYEEELLEVAKIEGRQARRIAFTMLCVAKYWNAVKAENNNWVNTSDKEVMAMANVKTTIKQQCQILHDLKDAGYIQFSRRVDSLNIRVLPIFNDGEQTLYITDYRNLGNQYLMYCGEPYAQCCECGLTIRKKNNKQLYCSGCKKEVKVRQNADARRRKLHAFSGEIVQ